MTMRLAGRGLLALGPSLAIVACATPAPTPTPYIPPPCAEVAWSVVKWSNSDYPLRWEFQYEGWHLEVSALHPYLPSRDEEVYSATIASIPSGGAFWVGSPRNFRSLDEAKSWACDMVPRG